MNKRSTWQVPVFIAFLFLGILLSVQFQTQQNYLNSLSAQSTEDLVAMIRKFYTNKALLISELDELTKQKNTLTAGQDGQNSIASLTQETTRLNVVLGKNAVKGPGIVITIPNDSPIIYLDLIDIVNELWTSGAEAISINGQRITSRTVIYYGENDTLYITVNGQRQAFPIRILAVGDPKAMESGLRLTGGIIDDLAVFKAYPQIRQDNNISIPGVERTPTFSYAKPN